MLINLSNYTAEVVDAIGDDKLLRVLIGFINLLSPHRFAANSLLLAAVTPIHASLLQFLRQYLLRINNSSNRRIGTYLQNFWINTSYHHSRAKAHCIRSSNGGVQSATGWSTWFTRLTDSRSSHLRASTGHICVSHVRRMAVCLLHRSAEWCASWWSVIGRLQDAHRLFATIYSSHLPNCSQFSEAPRWRFGFRKSR